MIDVYIHDTIGMGFDMSRPLGGSEVGLLLLADALGRAGLEVSFVEQDARACVVSRYSAAPNFPRRMVVYAADVFDARYDQHRGLPIQCVSEWQSTWFLAQGHAEVRVIRPFMGPHVLAAKEVLKEPGRWIYASAPGKGLEATLLSWKQNPRSEQPLLVTTTGYDEPSRDLCEAWGARYIGRFNPRDFAREIAKSEGMYYRNTAHECFPMTVAIARELGCELDIQCSGHDHCGLQEAMIPQDFDEANLVKRWLEFLRL